MPTLVGNYGQEGKTTKILGSFDLYFSARRLVSTTGNEAFSSALETANHVKPYLKYV